MLVAVAADDGERELEYESRSSSKAKHFGVSDDFVQRAVAPAVGSRCPRRFGTLRDRRSGASVPAQPRLGEIVADPQSDPEGCVQPASQFELQHLKGDPAGASDPLSIGRPNSGRPATSAANSGSQTFGSAQPEIARMPWRITAPRSA